MQPVGSISIEDIKWLAPRIEDKLPVPTRVLPVIWSMQPDLAAFRWDRMQYRADHLLMSIVKHYSNLIKPYTKLLLAIVEGDGFVEGLNFVFGLAMPSMGAALVFTKRLQWNTNIEVYRLRLLKESLHELGHLMGLEHCNNPRCVMSFSNSLIEVDRKEAEFCDECRLKLRRRYGVV